MKFLHLFRDPASEPHELHFHGDEGKGERPLSVVETDRFDQILFLFAGIPDDEKVIWDHVGMPIDNLCRAQDLGVCHRSFEDLCVLD